MRDYSRDLFNHICICDMFIKSLVLNTIGIYTPSPFTSMDVVNSADTFEDMEEQVDTLIALRYAENCNDVNDMRTTNTPVFI